MIEKLKKMNAEKFKKYIVSHQKEIQAADDQTREFILAKWGDKKPFPFPMPDPLPVHDHDDLEAKQAAHDAEKALMNSKVGPLPHPDTLQLTQAERRLAELIAISSDPPDYEVGEELDSYKDPLMVPAGLRRDDMVYRWVAERRLQASMAQFGGDWTPVNRINHPHADPRMFDATGGLRFSGEVVLCCTWRKKMEARQARIQKEFALKADNSVNNLQRSYKTPGGKTVIHTELMDDPGDSPADIPLTDDKYYDYEAPL
jgi:hypothetical protein